MIRKIPLALFLFTLAVVFSGPCVGMAGESENSGESSQRPPLRVRISGDFTPQASFNNDKGKMGVYGAGFRAQYWIFSLAYNVDDYTWENKEGLPFGNGRDAPWNTLHRFNLGANLGGDISENWTWFGGIFGTSSFEKELEDSFGGGARLGVAYHMTDRWDFSFGVAAFINSIRTRVYPLVGGFNYDGTDESGQGVFAHIGYPNSELGYAFADNLKLRAGVETNNKFYRLADDSTVLEKGFVEISGWQALLRLDYIPIENLTLSAGPTFHFDRRVKTFRNDGDRVVDEKLGNALGGMVEARYKF